MCLSGNKCQPFLVFQPGIFGPIKISYLTHLVTIFHIDVSFNLIHLSSMVDNAPTHICQLDVMPFDKKYFDIPKCAHLSEHHLIWQAFLHSNWTSLQLFWQLPVYGQVNAEAREMKITVIFFWQSKYEKQTKVVERFVLSNINFCVWKNVILTVVFVTIRHRFKPYLCTLLSSYRYPLPSPTAAAISRTNW